MFSRIRSKISKPKIGNKSSNTKKSEPTTKTIEPQTKHQKSSKKTVSLSDLKPCVKSKTPEFENPRILRRSDTFTVDDDDDCPIEYSGVDSTIQGGGYDNPNYKTFTRNKDKVDPIKTDVFETLYSKRPSKSSRSSKSSSDSYFANYKDHQDDLSTNRSNLHQYDSNTYKKSSNKNADQSLKTPNKILVNNNIDYQTKKPPEYIYGNDRNLSPNRSYAGKLINDYNNENDRFKTITLNSARRSFKNSYLTHSNADKAHQPSWFVDVEPSDNEQSTTRRKHSINNTYRNSFDEPQPVPRVTKSNLSRKETFKVENSDNHNEQPNRTSLNRKHTFRIEDNREPIPSSQPITYSSDKSSISRRSRHSLEPIRVEIQQSSISERTGKTIPVGVTAPYRRLQIDTIDHSHDNQYQSPTNKVSMKVASYNALNDIRENLAQLGRRQKYRSPTRDHNTTSTQTDHRRMNSGRTKDQSNFDRDTQKFITRCNVNYSSGNKVRETNVVEPRGRSAAVGPRLRTAERSVSRDHRYTNQSPIRQYDVKVVTSGPCLSYSPMKDRPLVRPFKPVTKPTEWTFNQVYL